MKPLRKISLTVIEPTTGYFQWQLLESSQELPFDWVEMRKSESYYNEWLDAFNEGFDAVLSFTRDGRNGPR